MVRADFVDVSYALCTGDVECSARFYISNPRAQYDRDRFGFLLSHFDAVNQTYVAERIENSADMWLMLMRTARFCTDNEEWVSGVGCECRRGRTCHELNAQDRIVDVRILNGIVASALIVAFFVSWRAVYYIDVLASRVRELDGRVADAQYLRDGGQLEL